MFGRENETHRIKDMISYIDSNDLQNIDKMRSEDFTRNRILTIPIMILIALNKQSKTLNMELYNFSEKIGFNEIGKRITKHAYSIARKKLNPQVFKALNTRYLSKLYKHKGTYKTFKGYLLIAGDASKVILPNIKSLREIYGGKKCDDGILRSTSAHVSMLYDCMNHFIFDLVIDKYKISEKTLMFRNIKNLNTMGFLKDKKKIFIFDRGYPSLEFIYKLIYEENTNFVFRLPKSMYKKERKSMTVKDAFIDLILTHRRIGDSKASKKIKNEFRKLGKINIRITTIIIGKWKRRISN